MAAETSFNPFATSSPLELSDDPYGQPFKPSAAALVGALTTAFSLIFLFLLYLKHCNNSNNSTPSTANSRPSHVRKNSGVDHALLDSLPVFQFRSLKGQNHRDCAVCLAVFQDSEVLRLLPKCRHVFHVGCVDAWLHAHSTCPLCRDKVESDDVVVLVEEDAKAKSLEGESSIRGQNDAAWRGEDERAGTASLDSAERGLEHHFEARDLLCLTSETVTWEARGRSSDSSCNVVSEVMENGSSVRRTRSFEGLLVPL